MAAIRVALGNPAQAVEADLAKVRTVRPDDAEAFFVEGALRLRDGQVGEARRLLGKAIEASKAKTSRTLLRAQYFLARIECDAGRISEGEQLLKEMLAVNERHVRARRLLEQCRGGMQGVARGVGGSGTSQPVVQDRPSPSVQQDAGAAQAVAARPSGGGAKPKAGGVEQAQGSYASLVARGESLQRSGATAQAQRLFEKALEQRPAGVEALTGLAYCYLDGNRFQAAISTFQRALGQDPRYGEAVIGLAEAYKLIGNKAKSLEYYQRYLEIGGPRRNEAERNVRELKPSVEKTGSEEKRKPLEPVTPPVAPKEKTGEASDAPPQQGQAPAPQEKPATKAGEENPSPSP